ncbi:MAG: hypothetical protein GC192_00120 [Bacteroidetes bacterium]|nr:hypothetical protein [Bacteroidota bacterium]
MDDSLAIPINIAQSTLDTLLALVGRHALVVELLAKTAEKQGWAPKNMLKHLETEGLSHLETKAEVDSAHNTHEHQRIAN